MATLGHVAVGLAAARGALPTDEPPHKLALAMTALAFVSMAPDLDVVAFALHIPYAAPWGHRGAGHSLAMALGVGALVGAALKLPGCSRWKSALVTAAVLATHTLLDTLTDGGLGMALFWPLTDARFFAPWQPIPVAPIGARFFSPRGLHVFLTEALYFAPLLVYALWPRSAWRRLVRSRSGVARV